MSLTNMRLKDWLVLGSGALFVPFLVFAQATPLIISVSPNPAGTDEAVSASVTVSNANTTLFTWSVNGAARPELSGVGKSAVFFAAPSNPGILRIGVTASPATEASSTAETIVPLALSETTKAFQKISSQATDLLLQQQEIEEQVFINLSAEPDTPAPGETATFRVRSFQTDLSQAAISWTINGKSAGSGNGLTAIPVAVGAAGSVTTVRAALDLPDGRHAEAEKTVVPSLVLFYWWSDSYVPAWYRGKALPAPGTTIFIQARPSFSTAVSQGLTYTWSLNDEVVGAVSGRGRSIFPFRVPAGGISDTIKVRVTNSAGMISQEAEFAPPAAEAEALLYEVRPLAGLDVSRALRTLTRNAGAPVDIGVEPFFIPRSMLSLIRYQWNFNGSDVAPDGKRPRILTVNSGAESRGLQHVRISLIDPSGAISGAEKSFELQLQ